MPHSRPIAAATLFVFFAAVLAGCYSWHPLPITDLDVEHEGLVRRQIRLDLKDGSTIEMSVRKIEFPFVEGGRVNTSDRFRGQPVRVDLREVERLEVRELAAGKTTGVIIAGAAAAVLVTFLIVLLTKESCPFVYLDRGGDELGFVGEAYAGAALRSIQRDDLLPLPELAAAPRVDLRLVNEARETQMTDLLELWLVDHPAGRRVVSTFDAGLLTVGSSSSPLAVADLEGRTVTDDLRAADTRVWQSDLEAVSAMVAPPLRDGLVAEFDALDGERAVLEIRGGNTPWLDLVFGRFFALFGDSLDRLLDEGNEPAAAARVRRWKEREGVDLAVAIWSGGVWRQVALVPTVGPIALRDVAVPLPPDPASASSGRIRVRIEGGMGFWRIDRLALAPVLDEGPTYRRIAPSVARGAAGEDQRAALARTDGQYDRLDVVGQSLALSFETPPLADGQLRSGFLFTNGYYNVHPPVQRERSLGTLHTLREEPRSLARFGLDLYRTYSNLARGTAVAELAPGPAPSGRE